MADDEFGSGIALDKSLDFTLTPDGDLDSFSGTAELNKDLAFQLNVILEQYRGAPLTPNVRDQIRSDTVNTLLSDNRVESVVRGAIKIQELRNGTVRLFVDYITSDGEQELVFEL